MSVVFLAAMLAACADVADGDVGIYSSPTPTEGSSGAGTVPPPAASVAGASGVPNGSDAGRPGYDPNVGFKWPEADPTLVCLSGTYSGQFNCQMNAGGLFPSGPLAGPVSFTLKQSANGEFLEIANGSLKGTLSAVFTFVADLVGRLDCSTDEFHAQALNGVSLGGTFGGTLDGKLDRPTQTLTGTWSLAQPFGPPCVGHFSLVRMP